MKTTYMVLTALVATLFAFETFAEGKTTTTKTTAAKATTKTYKPLAEARARIAEVIADSTKTEAVIKDLSPEDQKTFLADVNAAISKLPGSIEDKTAKYLNVNRAALTGSSENKADILAVTFATVPPESLTVISEVYANDLFNRDADASQKVTDTRFQRIATEVVGKVEKETTGSDDAGVRNTLAILMFVKADNGKIENLANTLVETMPDATTREIAKKEWIPAATAKEGEKSYDSMLAYSESDSEKAPNLEIVLTLAGPQILDAMLVDMTSGMNDNQGVQTTPVVDQAFGGFDDASAYIQTKTDSTSASSSLNSATPVSTTPGSTVPWNPDFSRDDVNMKAEKDPRKVAEQTLKEQEPDVYPYSNM